MIEIIASTILEDDRHFLLKRKKEIDSKNELVIWETESEDLKIIETIEGVVQEGFSTCDLKTPMEEILDEFRNKRQKIRDFERSGIEYVEEDESVDDDTPFDSEDIRVDTKQFNVSFVNELIGDGDIDLSPDFQRGFVWKSIKRRSRLIESMMLRIPLPVFYLAQDKQGKFQVVDGLQRLTVINQFLENKFALQKCEYLGDQDKKYFDKKNGDNIDAKYKRRITQTQLIFNIIDPQTPIKVKFEIFKRINQGGAPLKPQEIRNCMISKEGRELVRSMTTSEEFRKATDYSVNPTRMEDQELILRFIGFYLLKKKKRKTIYKSNMTVFLDELIEYLGEMDVDAYEEIKEMFKRSMENAIHLFGKYAFRKCKTEHLLPNARKQFINKSLFTVWSVLLVDYDPSWIKESFSESHLALPIAKKIEDDKEYFNILTIGTNQANYLELAFTKAELLIQEYLK